MRGSYLAWTCVCFVLYFLAPPVVPGTWIRILLVWPVTITGDVRSFSALISVFFSIRLSLAQRKSCACRLGWFRPCFCGRVGFRPDGRFFPPFFSSHLRITSYFIEPWIFPYLFFCPVPLMSCFPFSRSLFPRLYMFFFFMGSRTLEECSIRLWLLFYFRFFFSSFVFISLFVFRRRCSERHPWSLLVSRAGPPWDSADLFFRHPTSLSCPNPFGAASSKPASLDFCVAFPGALLSQGQYLLFFN